MVFNILIIILSFYYCSGVFFAKKDDVLFSYDVTNISVCRTDKQSFRRILRVRLVDCVQECGLRPHCEALSYGRIHGMCNLFMTKDDGTFINENCLYITSEDIKVEKSPCNAGCPYRQACDLTSGECKVKECLRTTIENGAVLGNVFEIGSKVRYACDGGDESNVRADICRTDGTFNATSVCKKVIKDCAEVKSCNSSYVDGEYWLNGNALKGRKIKVYCSGLSTATPLEYITVDESSNYGYNAGGDDVTVGNLTKFDKIRINIESMMIIRGDTTFTNKPPSVLKYAVASSCNCIDLCPPLPGAHPWKGYFQISTEGTGLKFSDDVTWELVGYKPGMDNFERNLDNTVISAICGGYCGYCKPSAPLFLYYNEKDVVDDNKAIHPTCS